MIYEYVMIEREFGSAGTEIGKRLAAECGMNFYGREILEEVAKKLNTSVERIEQYEENTKGSFLYSVAMLGRMDLGENTFLSGEDYIYLEEQNVIQQLSQNGPAVFMGHCAGKALEENKGVLKVFIHADAEEKKKRIEEEYRIQENQIDSVMRKFDKKRSNYYLANTNQKWKDLENYDVVLNSGVLGVDGCVKMLKAALSDSAED